jgi:hypothetical protein
VLQVLGRMKQAMVEHSSSASHSFLLDDDSKLPFVTSDILAHMDDKVCVTQLLHCPCELAVPHIHRMDTKVCVVSPLHSFE